VVVLRVSDVDISRQKIYFAFKADTSSEVRSVALSGDAEVFGSRTQNRPVDDEVINGLY